jgi:eukaryotic-like serine/threonine-protein kinase
VTATSLIGQVILGRYRIVRQVARGGMGAIYLARNEGAAGFVRPVIVKVILQEHTDKDSMVRMFEREARITSQLRHPNIVSILDFREENRAYFMVLDYVHGLHLGVWSRFLRSVQRKFEPGVAAEIAASVLDALHYSHTLTGADGEVLRIIHRDVTPSNVMVDIDGHVKLTDFGIARMQRNNSEYRTQSRTIKGKFSYLAPELLRGSEPDEQTDLYSCAVVLHELLTGRNEFRSPDVAGTVGLVLQHKPARVDEVRDDVSKELADVIDKGLAKDSADRYLSAREFSQALRAASKWSSNQASEQLRASARLDFFDSRMVSALGARNLDALEAAWRNPGSEILSVQQEAHSTIAEKITADVSNDESGGGGYTEPNVPAKSHPRTDIRIGRQRVGLYAVGGVTLVTLAIALYAAIKPTFDPPTPANPGPAPILMVSGKQDAVLTPGPGAEADAGTGDAAIQEPEKPPVRVVKRPKPPKPENPALLYTRTFQRKNEQLEGCFSEHTSSIAGSPKIQVRFNVAESGQVLGASIIPEDIAATPLGQCILKIAKDTKFHKGNPVTVSIPVTVRRTRG